MKTTTTTQITLAEAKKLVKEDTKFQLFTIRFKDENNVHIMNRNEVIKSINEEIKNLRIVVNTRPAAEGASALSEIQGLIIRRNAMKAANKIDVLYPQLCAIRNNAEYSKMERRIEKQEEIFRAYFKTSYPYWS